MTGYFHLKDDKGAILADFQATKEAAEAGPQADDAELAEMFRDLGEDTADAVIRWVQGDGLAS